MSIYLVLFFEFFKIGLFTIGGGYAMIPLIEQATISKGWITIEELMNMIAISESTPGPFALNMATFVGFSQAGAVGAICSTLGVVMPSFLIILFIARLVSKINTESRTVKGIMSGISPVVVGLVLVAFVNMLLKNLFGYVDLNTPLSAEKIDVVGIIIAVVIILLMGLRKKTSVITVVVLSGLMGMLGYYIESII